MACWNKTKVHVAGVPLASVADCRLVVLSGRRCSRCMERRHNLCFFQFASERSVSRMSYGGSSSPTPWKRGPLAPPVVVVVGEGQVNLGVRRPCSGHGQSLQQSFVGRSILMMNQINLRLRFRCIRLRNSHGINSRATGGIGGVCSAVCSAVNQW